MTFYEGRVEVNEGMARVFQDCYRVVSGFGRFQSRKAVVDSNLFFFFISGSVQLSVSCSFLDQA